MNKKCGIVLCAVGNQMYYSLCNTLIRDIREVMEGFPIAVYTDNPSKIIDADIIIEGIHNQDKVFRAKIQTCQRTPFEKTVFIDVDSRLLRPINCLFEILDHYDFGLCFADGREILRREHWSPKETGLPLSSSTMIFRKNSSIDNLFRTWEDDYLNDERFPGKGDQVYLKYVLYHAKDIRYVVLPNEFRCNTDNPQFVGGAVRILTSKISDIDTNGLLKRSYLDNMVNSKLRRRLIQVVQIMQYRKMKFGYLNKLRYIITKYV